MKAIYIKDDYQESGSERIQGNETHLKKERARLRKEGFNFFSGGNGTEVWKRDTHCNVTFQVGNDIHIKDLKDEVKKFYNLQKLYESRFNVFCDDWSNGKIIVDSTENGTIISIKNA